MIPVIQTYITDNPDCGMKLIHRYSEVDDHHWIEIEQREKNVPGGQGFTTYLFDGTAGQKDPSNIFARLGIYGKKDKLMEQIRNAKDLGSRIMLAQTYETGGKSIPII